MRTPTKKVVAYACDSRWSEHDRISKIRAMGYEVWFYQNAEEVMQAFEQGSATPDMLITDCVLPQGDRFNTEETSRGTETGVVMYKELRRRLARLPVVIFNITDGADDSLRSFQDPFLRVLFEDGHATASMLQEVQRRLS